MKNLILTFLLTVLYVHLIYAQDSTSTDLLSLSLEELMNINLESATRYETPLQNVPVFAVVITRQQIEERGYATLLDILHDVPGFDIIHVNGLYPQLVHQRGLRGNNNRTLIFIDGIPAQNLYEMNMLGTPLDYDLTNVNQVEIIYGPASALYGSNAVTGIINIRTLEGKAYQKQPVLNTRVRFFGTWDRTGVDVGIGFGQTYPNKNISWTIQGSFREGEGFDFGNFQNLISRQPLRGSAFSSQYDASWYRSFQTNIKFQWKKFSSEYFFHLYRMGEGTFNNGFWYLDHQVTELRYRWNNSVFVTNLPNSQWAPYDMGYRLRYQTSLSPTMNLQINFIGRQTGLRPESFDADLGPPKDKNLERDQQIVPGDSIYAFFYRRQSFSYSLYYQLEYTPHPNHKIISGVSGEVINTPLDYEVRRFLPGERTFSEWFIQPRVLLNNFAFYLQDEFTLKHLKVLAGFRADYFSYKFRTPMLRPRKYGALNPRVGIYYSPSKFWAIKVIGGSAFRTPTPWEFFSTTTFRKPNPNLKPEINTNVDVVFDWYAAKNLNFTFNINYQYLKDVIFNSVPIGNGLNQNQNIGAISQHGAIILVNWLPTKNVKIHGNYTFQYSKFENLPPLLMDRFTSHKDNMVPDLPLHKVNIIASWKARRNFLITYRGNWVGDRNTIQTNPVEKVPGYWLSSLSFQFQHLMNSAINIEFAIWNIENRMAWDPGLRSADGFRFPTMHPVGHRTFYLRMYIES